MSENIKIKRTYLPSFDIVRIICVIFIMLSAFSDPLVSPIDYICHFTNFASGTMFLLYGFAVLRDGADLLKNIKHTAIALGIMFAVAVGISIVWMMLKGQPITDLLNKKNIINFFVLCKWPKIKGIKVFAVVGYLLQLFYSLVIFWLFKFLKRFDYIFCILLFVFSIIFGEFAGFFGFSFFGFKCIDGMFLTTAIPYMLLGRIIHDNVRKWPDWFTENTLPLYVIGFLLSIAEFLALLYSGHLVSSEHFIGFIFISVAMCLSALKFPEGNVLLAISDHASIIYKGMFYSLNICVFVLIVIFNKIISSDTVFVLCYFGSMLLVPSILYLLFKLVASIKLQRKSDEYVNKHYHVIEITDEEEAEFEK